MPNEPRDRDNQGEGNRDAARRYDQQQQDFVRSGRVDDAAREAEPRSEGEARELERAEEEGQRKSRGEDPHVERP